MKPNKQKYSVEYLFSNVSSNVLWNKISTALGLQEWFADHVDNRDKEFRFSWGKEPRIANVIHQRTGQYIRFQWHDSDEKEYFEMRLQQNELTNDTTLTVIDFAEEGEEKDDIQLWDMQINTLKRIVGIA